MHRIRLKIETSGLKFHLLIGKPLAVVLNDCFSNNKNLENLERIQSSWRANVSAGDWNYPNSPRTQIISKESFCFRLLNSTTDLHIAELSYRECSFCNIKIRHYKVAVRPLTSPVPARLRSRLVVLIL